jgi:hypothetical protein
VTVGARTVFVYNVFLLANRKLQKMKMGDKEKQGVLQNLRLYTSDLDRVAEMTAVKLEKGAKPKVIQTEPGLCLKTSKSQLKGFINICHTTELPPPMDISEEDLFAAINCKDASTYKIPMSMSKIRDCKHARGNTVRVVDVAINSGYYEKRIKSADSIFYLFLVAVICECIEQNYGLKVDPSSIVVLNRQVFDSLVTHQLSDCDIKRLQKYNSDENDRMEVDISSQENVPEMNLVHEISTTIITHIEPQHMLFIDPLRRELIAEFWLPNARDVHQILIEASEERLKMSDRQYDFDKFLPLMIDAEKILAEFDHNSMVSLLNT